MCIFSFYKWKNTKSNDIGVNNIADIAEIADALKHLIGLTSLSLNLG